VLELLSGLVDKSLVELEPSTGGYPDVTARYRMLETVRQYAWEQLAASVTSPGGYPEAAAVRERHLDWCLALAEATEPQLTGPEQAIWLRRLQVEHDNLRAALVWARERAGAAMESVDERGLRLAAALWRFWYMHGHLSEGRGWLLEMLDRHQRAAPALRARALNGAGNLAHAQGDYARAVALHVGSLALRRQMGDAVGISNSLNNLGWAAFNQGNHARAATFYEESLALRRGLGDQWAIAGSLNNLGLVAAAQGDYARAEVLFKESLCLQRALGDTWGTAGSLGNLGNVALALGAFARAATLYEEGLALLRELDDTAGIARTLSNLGLVAAEQGDYARAEALLGEGLALQRDMGDRAGLAESLGNLGLVTHRQGDLAGAGRLLKEALVLHRTLGGTREAAECLENLAAVAKGQCRAELAAHLLGAAEGLRAAIQAPLEPRRQVAYQHTVTAVRSMLGAEGCAKAWAEGRARSLEEAIADALALESTG
jgi:non-specific serine/threonine protein kinase